MNLHINSGQICFKTFAVCLSSADRIFSYHLLIKFSKRIVYIFSIYLITHKNSLHEKIKYKCDQCDKEFNFASGRNKHVKSFHKQERYQCSLCDYQATDKGYLGTHKKSVHDCVKHSCKICGNEFSQKASLSKHIKSKYKGMKYNVYGILCRNLSEC